MSTVKTHKIATNVARPQKTTTSHSWRDKDWDVEMDIKKSLMIQVLSGGKERGEWSNNNSNNNNIIIIAIII